MEVVVRRERPDDANAVFDVNQRAFESEAEAKLVERLRSAASPNISLVAEVDGAVVGHIFFSPVTLSNGPADVLCLGLGPMAVRPDMQNLGIGSRLVDEGLCYCRDLGASAIFVLGHPDYYPRFGFRPATESGLRYKDQRFDPYFFVVELAEGCIEGVSGAVSYHPAFDTV